MRTYEIVLVNGNVSGTRAYSAEQALRTAIAIFGDDGVDHVHLV